MNQANVPTTLTFDPDELRTLLAQFSFSMHGDFYERTYRDKITARFPNIENFWKWVVIPHTQRIVPRSRNPMTFRPGMHEDVRRISRLNYSLFLNLWYCHKHLDALSESATSSLILTCDLEDFYAHICTACDLVDALLEKAYLILLDCREEKCEFSQLLTREGWLTKAGEWFDREYLTFHDRYVRTGKTASWRIPARKQIDHEFVVTYLGLPALWKEYAPLRQHFRELRNAMLHDTQIGRLILNDTHLIPKASAIQRYRTWEEVFEAIHHPDRVSQDFGIVPTQLANDLEKFEDTLERLWAPVIEALTTEFFEPDRDRLRTMYCIRFGAPSGELAALSESTSVPSPSTWSPTTSGTGLPRETRKV